LPKDDPFYITTNLYKYNPPNGGALFAVFDPREVYNALSMNGCAVHRSRIGLDPSETDNWAYIYAKEDLLELANAYKRNPLKD
jgi:hypothetical protein